MNRFHIHLLILILLSGCQSVVLDDGGVKVEDVTSRERVSPARGAESMSGQRATNPSDHALAISSLLKSANDLLLKQKWWPAIDTAERGLRIERKEAEFYKVLSSAYRAMGQHAKAHDFALQGLRYCGSKKDLCDYLSRF